MILIFRENLQSHKHQIIVYQLFHKLLIIQQKKMVTNMKDFLKNLDQEFGDGKFTCYLSIFEEQEILVNQLPKLSDSEYISMGVIIIGRRQRLRDEAKKY